MAKAKKAQKAAGYFVVYRSGSGRFGCLEIELRDNLSGFGHHFGDSDQFKLAWQCDDERDYWYAFRALIETREPSDLLAAGRLMQKVIAATPNNLSPEGVVGALRRLGFVQVAYHRGMARYYPLSEWPQGGVYVAEYVEDSGRTEGVTRVVAADPEDAQRKCLALAAEEMAEDPHGYMARHWERWLAGGRAVRMVAAEQELRVPTLRPGVRDPGPEQERVEKAQAAGV